LDDPGQEFLNVFTGDVGKGARLGGCPSLFSGYCETEVDVDVLADVLPFDDAGHAASLGATRQAICWR
jgi:hypothetical protein